MSRSRRARVQLSRAVAIVVSFALLVTGLEAQEKAVAAPAADPKPQAAKVDSRPDLVSAVVSARSQGSRVEVESLRSETSSTWANPDGTMTTEAHAAPVRFKDAKGAWRSIDLTLAKGTDGMVAPLGHGFGLHLGKRTAAAGGVFASATAGAGRQVEWMAPWKLPEPSIDGTTATYAEVQPGVDLKLDARRTGFETDLVVKERPATAPVWRIPLRTKGLTARQNKDGAVEFVDAKNVVRSRIPVGQMWDGVTDEHTKMPVNNVPVKMSVEQATPGKAILVLTPDPAWFMDPARVFPVTVDPTYEVSTTRPSFDTWVQSAYPDDLSGTIDLRVGMNGTKTERTFMNFATAPFAGKDVLSSFLSVWQYGGVSCTPTVVNVRAVQPVSTATRWANQPTLGAVYGSLNTTKGFSSACPGGRIEIPMTSLAQAWSTASYPTGGLALVAANEADVNSWKRFYASGGPADPYISFTWNRTPNAPATVETTEAVAYAAPGESTSSMYSPTRRPWVRTKATDPDGNTVKYVFEFMTGSNTVVGTCTSSVYASGTTAGCRPATDLPDNTLLYIRAKANDGRVDGPWTSYQTRLRIGAATPAAPVVSCPSPYVINSWQDNPPAANVVCTVTATGTGYNAPGYVRITADGQPLPTNFAGGAPGQIKITPSSDPAVAKTTVTFDKNTPGLHRITATAETPAGTLSSSSSYSFGWGGSAMTSPTAELRITTANTIRITASGPPKGQSSTVTAKVRWRTSGYGGAAHDTVGWTEDATALPVTDNGAAGVTVNTVWGTMNAKIDNSLDSDPDTAGIQPTTLNERVPVKLDIQVCFTYASSSQCTWSQTPDTTVQRVPHAFGNGYPTSGAGPGQVALWTGEFNTDETDISVPGYSGSLMLSRSHSTYAGALNSLTGVFGPGWTAQFDGTDVGGAGFEVVDSTRIDGTIALLGGDGSGLVFESPTGERRTTAALAPGVWEPADEDTELDGSRFTVTGSGISTVLSLIEDDGTVTTWTPAAAPTASNAVSFRPAGIAEPGIASKTTYSYDGNGRVIRIMAPAPPGVTCPATGTLNPGCRALRFVYTTIGASQVRLSEAWLDIYNPDKSGGAGMDSVKVAAYTYDSNGLLTKVTDPRSNLSTEYGYNAQNHLTSVKPAGQVPYQLQYVTVDQRAKLDSVTRQRPAGDPAGGTATLAKFVYDVPLTGPGLPDLSAGSVGRWNQKAIPTNGFAVFGPERQPAGSPSADDWQYAELQYTDGAGYAINTAKYGAGDWQYTSTDYDAQGNEIRELDERALRLVIDNNMPAGATVDQLASLTIYNSDIKNSAGDTILTPAGTLVTDTYGPARYAALRDGSIQWSRVHTRTSFDEGAPNGGINPDTSLPYRAATTETVSAFDPGTGAEEVISRTLTDYTAAVTGEPDGWALGLAGTVSFDANPAGPRSETTGDQVHVTRYDSEGRTIETRQAESSGADAGTTRTVYYTTAANPAFADCGGKPQWAGLICKSYVAAQPTSSAGSTPTLPVTTTTAFNYLLTPKVVVESSGAVTRTTTTKHLLDGRVQSVKTAIVGLTGSTPSNEKVTTYDAATGDPTMVSSIAGDGSVSGTVTTGYDGWGRPTTYQPSGEQPTTTVYDASGAVATITDANGSTRYTYDGVDAAGKTERRGLATKVEVTAAGSTWSSSGAYDADGALMTQKLPGGITQHHELDNAGEPVSLRYTGQVTTTSADGSTSVEPNGPWMSWSVDNEANGRVSHEWTPEGSAFRGQAGDAIPYDRSYSYDSVGRLTRVRDRTATATGVDITDPTATPCVTRTYGFDRNGNRNAKFTATSGPDGVCPAGGGTSVSRVFDTADRPVNGANGAGNYSYDQLGRTTTVPASDASNPVDGPVTIGYYDDDSPRSVTQNGTSTTYTLDAAGRRSTEATTGSSGSSESIRHYTDASDNPTWITTGASTQRYAELIGNDLSLIVDGNGTGALAIAGPRGDVVTTVDLPGAAPATAIEGWNSFDEYGNANQTNSATTGSIRYGWLGTEQRAATDTGIILMGARLYNPVTGLFTSLDPVEGGNPTAYTYPLDPINETDTDGEFCHCSVGVAGGRSGGGRVGGSSAGRAGSSNGGYGKGGARGSAQGGRARWGAKQKGPSYPKKAKGKSKNKKKNNYQGKSYGYTIYYRHRGRWHTWKYGITSQTNYRGRPNEQLAGCQYMMRSRCKVGKRIRYFRSKSSARLWEYGSIASYWRRHGTCPPGQWKSCR
nr:DNRLRE domain-containing protein [Kribbella solani]